MGDKIGFIVKQLELSYQAHLIRPSFRLLTHESRLLDGLLVGMAQFGVTPGDIRLDTAVPSLAEAGITCMLHKNGVLLKIRPDRFEASCVKIPEGDVFQRVIRQTYAVVRESHPSAELRSHTIAMHLHGNLEGTVSCADFLRRYISCAPELEPTSFRGAVYQFPGEEGRLSSSFEIQPSLLHPGALFTRFVVTLDAQRVTSDNALATAEAYCRKVANAFGIEEKGTPLHAG